MPLAEGDNECQACGSYGHSTEACPYVPYTSPPAESDDD